MAQKPADAHVPSEILVKLQPGYPARAAVADLQSHGALVVEHLGDLGWVRVILPHGLAVSDAMNGYARIDGVENVQPNFYYHLLATPNDPLFPEVGMWGLRKISAPAAWDLATGSPSVVVADIDTGMQVTHQDLAANVWVNPGEIAGNGIDDDANGYIDDIHGYDFRFNDPDVSDEFGQGHGTHTAGTIGAAGNNGIGVVGLNWAVKIMPIKIYSSAGTDTTSAMLINAYNYVRMMKDRGVNIRVTNNSYSGCNEACGYDQATKDALDAMGNAGILNVFAAGNDFRDVEQNPAFPASYTSPSVLSVAASDSNDNKPPFSNWGTVSVDLAAPGAGILSTVRSTTTPYGVMSGTSMATPHVAGAAALLTAHHPTLSPASLKATLMNTVDQLPVWANLVKTGGRLNVFNALQNPTVCSFNLSEQSIAARNKGGGYSVSVTVPQNCDYTVKSNVKWINVTSAVTVSGSSVVSFRVRLNPMISRSGTITIADKVLTVTQSRV